MPILAWIVLGGFAGWIASKIMGRDAEMGILKNIICGVIGAFIGSFVLNFLTHTEIVRSFNIETFFSALLGSCLFLWMLNLIQGRRSR